ncbi:MAG TPA: hypothetical protein V6D22_15040 [Candidatus Obscuribacterales bacterium]
MDTVSKLVAEITSKKHESLADNVGKWDVSERRQACVALLASICEERPKVIMADYKITDLNDDGQVQVAARRKFDDQQALFPARIRKTIDGEFWRLSWLFVPFFLVWPWWWPQPLLTKLIADPDTELKSLRRFRLCELPIVSLLALGLTMVLVTRLGFVGKFHQMFFGFCFFVCLLIGLFLGVKRRAILLYLSMFCLYAFIFAATWGGCVLFYPLGLLLCWHDDVLRRRLIISSERAGVPMREL